MIPSRSQNLLYTAFVVTAFVFDFVISDERCNQERQRPHFIPINPILTERDHAARLRPPFPSEVPPGDLGEGGAQNTREGPVMTESAQQRD